jgi:hypothetical protein
MTKKQIFLNQKKKVKKTFEEIAKETNIPISTVHYIVNKEDNRMERILASVGLIIKIEEK